MGEVSWERMVPGVEKVRERLLRACGILDKAGVPYAGPGADEADLIPRQRPEHLRNLIDVGLVDEEWLARLEPLLAERLQHLFEDPDG